MGNLFTDCQALVLPRVTMAKSRLGISATCWAKYQKISTGEIDSLIGELRRLRGKLQTDGDRIQRDIEEYATLSQQVMQLTKIIYDSVAKLPNAHTSVDSGRTH